MKAFFSVHNGIIVALLFLPLSNKAQSRIEVGTTVEFGGTIVSLNEQGRQRLQQEVDQLYVNRGEVNQQLEQLRQLDPLIQMAMKTAALPVDFRFLLLPLDAKQGYWNIPDGLLQQLGLSKTASVDEHQHPLLATEAATAYLARLQQRKANSFQTILSYFQAGDSVQTERLSGIGDYALLDPACPVAVWKLLARQLVFNREETVFRPNRTFLLWTHEQSSGRTLTDIAFQYNLSTDRLQPYDKWLTGSVIPTEGYFPVLVRMLPEEYAAARGRLENAKQNPPGPDLGFPVLRRMPPVNSVLNTPIILYEINSLPGIQAQPGDNVITLAFYGGISVRKFLEYNDMTERNVVRPGEIYYLASKLRRAKVPFHVVDRGQTLAEISAIYGVQLKHLLRYNDIEPNQHVAEGRVIWLQRSRPRNQAIEFRQIERPQRPPVSIPDSTLTNPVVPTDSTQLITQIPDDPDTLLTDNVSTKPLTTSATSSTTVAKVSNTSLVIPKARMHTVQLGQTYYAILQRYGVTLNQLYRWNNLSERVPLRVGQQLIVGNPNTAISGKVPPAEKPIAAPPPGRQPKQGMKTILRIERIPIDSLARKPSAGQYHVVQHGQTVYRVALINKVPIEQVMRLNNLHNYTIEVGQRLRVR